MIIINVITWSNKYMCNIIPFHECSDLIQELVEDLDTCILTLASCTFHPWSAGKGCGKAGKQFTNKSDVGQTFIFSHAFYVILVNCVQVLTHSALF